MNSTLKSVAGLCAAAGLALLASAASAQVTVYKYLGTQTKDSGTGITFTGTAIASFPEANNFFDTRQNTISDFNSGTNYSGNEAFGLDVKGSFTVGPGGTTFTFRQGSDDGSYSYLTGPGFSGSNALISIPGPTNFTTKTDTETLGPGTYNYEVKYSESNGAPGALRFSTPVPEPSSVASMGLGGLGLFGLLLRARKGKAKSIGA